MLNYQIIVEYLGLNYVGWQIQKNGISIQSQIEKALTKTLNSKIKIIGSGRTDAGVNALGQSANFYFKNEIKDHFKFLNTVNFFLRNSSIAIINLKKRNKNFHARHSAKKRCYEYIIFNRTGQLAIYKNRSWLIKKELDFKKMKKAINYFYGTHNFSAFRSSSCSAKSPIKTISKVNIKKSGEKILITFQSKSFLQKQVRSMVGCLKYVGENKWKPEKIKLIINSKKRKLCAPPAPPDGLYLKRVFY
ncbi:tRNA pseudouridine(38-40) synthase TruA [Pelagibacteraceae bacterium]|jgi:tRNA pseudouridine38-40 synthase|nr:tRNA pseudouridine(38-40) synthase TruA [Pelagibacteraceae bacterium]